MADSPADTCVAAEVVNEHVPTPQPVLSLSANGGDVAPIRVLNLVSPFAQRI